MRTLLRSTPLARHVRKRRAVRALQAWTPHDEALAGFYSQFVAPGALCFDVGANVGERTKLFLRLGARVVAVEPQQECLDVLAAVYRAEPRLTILPQVLGEKQGEAELHIADTSTLSTLSTEWSDRLRASGRFGQNEWREKRRVEMTTLDRVIERTGSPAFIKIDVEGSEYRVLSGLSQPVAALAFEFVSEFEHVTVQCLDYLDRLGRMEVNYVLSDSLELAGPWLSSAAMKGTLAQLSRPYNGDIYVRFAGA